ncbi:MAG: Rne/Rng family ribonuclease [Myxococcaceae bacterium]|nr:Rne/Rng family ribonuclease [Myxococcaceae bacterium]
MSSILVINAAGRETRVALVENGHIAEFYLERNKDKGIVGNIYKGRVTRVLPGMQAAFVDVGLDKAAFLYVTDVFYDPEFSKAHFELTEGEHDESSDVPDEPDAHAHGDEAAVDQAAEAHDAAHAEAAHPESAVERHEEGAHPVEGAHQADAVEAIELPESVDVSMTGEHEVVTFESVTPAVTGAEVLATAIAASQAAPEQGPAAGAETAVSSPTGADVVHQAIADAQETKGQLRAPREQRHRESRRDRERKREERREEKRERKTARIEDLLKVGQEVLVQISKDPIGTKGARLTSHISIPGRHLVFMPTVDHVGISRRIGNEKERRRLREIVDGLRPPGTGFIVRTVAENVPKEKLEADIRFLIEVWNETVRKNEKQRQPGLMHPDLDLILRATRDLFAQDVEKLVIDDRDEYERVVNFVSSQDAALKDRVLLHDNEEPIFDAYGIEEEIKRATQRKVWLKSGGYLIMDQAEALTAIDVNSGRYVGKKSLEETITRINVEAAKEIVYQLRLRNIGGIIICDFIDMEKQQNRDKVFKALQEALGRDKAKTNVLRISELGLVEMTRKRVRESIGRMLHEDCAYCDGQGFVKTPTTVAYEIFRELRRSAGSYKDPTLVINCQHEVANLLLGEEKGELRHLMDRFNKTIQVKPRTDIHREQYDIYARPLHGNEYKVASSADPVTPAQYGAPKRPAANEPPSRQDRGGGGGGGGGERDRERGGRGRNRGRDRGNGRRDERREERREERQANSRQGGGGGNANREGSVNHSGGGSAEREAEPEMPHVAASASSEPSA